MGLFDDDEELTALVEQSNEFEPLDLNEGEVQALFNRCLATKDSKEILGTTIFETYKENKDSNPMISFDKERISNNLKSIEYLYGQLLAKHHYYNVVSINDIANKYTGKTWATNIGIIMKFLHLGRATSAILKFNAKTKSSNLSSAYPPTLSPKDPDFPAWWEAHKGEWED